MHLYRSTASLHSPGFIPPTLPPGFGQKTDGVRGFVVGHPQGLVEGKGRGGSRLSGIGRAIHASLGRLHRRASMCRDPGISDVRRAEAVSTIAVANAGEDSTVGADAMYPMLLLKKASSPGRGRCDAAPCGRVKGEGGAVAPAAADANDWAGACCAIFTTRDASRAAVFACSIYSSNRRRRASRRRSVWLASSSARWGRAAAYVKSEGPAWVPGSRELFGWRFADRGEPGCRRWCPVEREEASWRRSPGAGES